MKLTDAKMMKTITKVLDSSLRICRHNSTAVSVKNNVDYGDKMQAWQTNCYGGIKELQLHNVRMPIITKKNQVLVQVEAASVNQIDVAMLSKFYLLKINLKTMNKEKSLKK